MQEKLKIDVQVLFENVWEILTSICNKDEKQHQMVQLIYSMYYLN